MKKIVYRGEGRVDKQTGGPGQKAFCVLELESLALGAGFEFANKVAGGAIPREYIPSIEKGVKTALAAGILAGYPVVDVRVSVVDGSYHEVDSNDYAFTEAGRLACLDACRKAPMVLLEPIGQFEVIAPNEYVGPIIGDLNKRRGQLSGQDTLADGSAVVRARLPVAETFGYMTDLRSLTQGRASFALTVDGYAEMPDALSREVIARRGYRAM